MADYNLSGLSSRSFEQLIQSIAVRVFGPGAMVFGDGPDGAREATYEGRTSYPSPEDPWDGYIVIQAKFRQRPNATADAKWIITQLNDELKKFTKNRRGLRKPEYYVFCTNLVLTPAHGTGSKDRAAQLLEQYMRRLKGKDYAIWDYDQIRAFLDAYHDLRDAFAAWITPGDVLAEVMRNIQFSRPDFDRVMSIFLQKELLSDQYVNLEQAGHSADDRTPTAQVFIDLPVSLRPLLEPPTAQEEQQRRIVSEILSTGSQRLTPLQFIQSSGILDAPPPGRFVLIGGPGQGKTTVSQFICQLYRAAILKTRQTPLLPEVQQALGVIDSYCKSDNTSLPDCRRFPIRVTLNHFARILADAGPNDQKSLISYLTDRIAYRTATSIQVEDLRLWLQRYPWLLILDGLDEVPSSSNRDEVLAAIQDFWIDAAESQADILVVATTRPQGYGDSFDSKFYAHRYLTPLPNERALLYGARLANARYGNDPDREQRIIARLNRAAAEASTSRLMRSPLQITIMATLVDQTGQPPHERWRLFHDYYEVIYRRETERDIPAAELLRDHKSNIDEIHHQVGLLLQIESERRGLTDARLTAKQFGNVVRARLSSEGYAGSQLDGLSALIMEAAANRLVFLVGVEAGQVGFEIRSLQEFMAAESLMNGSDELATQRLNIIAPITHWRNVFLFCSGRCFAVDQHRRETVLSICITENETDGDELVRKSLGGSHLALEILIDGAPHRQPRFERSLARAALRLMDRPGQDAQFMLADVYQESMEEIYKEELGIRLDSAAVGPCSSAWSVLCGLVDRGVPWAVTLADIRWPPHISVQELLFRSNNILEGRYFRSEWCWAKIASYIPKAPLQDLWQFRFQVRLARSAKEAEQLLTAAGEFEEHLETSLKLGPYAGISIILRIIGIENDKNGDRVRDLIDSKRPDWKMLMAANSFRHRPTPSGLAEGLRSLSEVWNPQFKQEVARRVAWPMAACIIGASTEHDLLQTARAAERGDLGSHEDWKRAEDRWSRGITLEDLNVFDTHACRIGGYMADRGYPLTCADAHGGRVNSVVDAEELYKTFSEMSSSYMRASIADHIVSLMVSDGIRGKCWKWLDGKKVRELIVNIHGRFFGIPGMLVLPSDEFIKQDVVCALDYIGRVFVLWVTSDTNLTSVYEVASRGLSREAELTVSAG